ncbi:MAG TPA: hypothetical protein PKW95_20615 [bacterium]|nr:hypothetical protein [bacterium]
MADNKALRILYACNQPPGYGGASTESYEAIKKLRELGCHVTGLFIVGSAAETERCDPDRIGNVQTMLWRGNYDDPLPCRCQAYDLLVAKNYLAPHFFRRETNKPRVYITAGIDHVSHLKRPAIEVDERLPADCHDVRAFQVADHVIVHSTIDLLLYERCLPRSLLKKIHRDIVYTPNIAARQLDQRNLIPYGQRSYDLLFSASNWQRPMKNGALMRELCAHYRNARKIVVCGEEARATAATTVGLVPHRTMIDLLKQTKVVVIPSLYDPSPNLYAEAIWAGCNVVINRSVGNGEFHPPELIAPEVSLAGYRAALEHALALERQAMYRTPSPQWAARQLYDCLHSIHNLHRRDAGHGINKNFRLRA